MAEYDDYHFKFKVSILGEKGVGKSAFLDSKNVIRSWPEHWEMH